MPTAAREDWSAEELQGEAEDLRGRLHHFRKSLGRFFVDKQELIDLMVVAAIAQEPLLLVGPPGTAKSDLVLKFKDALGLAATSAANRGSCRRRASASSTRFSSRTPQSSTSC